MLGGPSGQAVSERDHTECAAKRTVTPRRSAPESLAAVRNRPAPISDTWDIPMIHACDPLSARFYNVCPQDRVGAMPGCGLHPGHSACAAVFPAYAGRHGHLLLGAHLVRDTRSKCSFRQPFAPGASSPRSRLATDHSERRCSVPRAITLAMVMPCLADRTMRSLGGAVIVAGQAAAD